MEPKFRTTSVMQRGSESALAINSVLRNTFMLLGLTFVFSAITAGIAMVTNAAPMNPFLVFIGYFGLLFAVRATANSALGILMVFALTGFMGYTLGPILNFYITAFSNGTEMVLTALGGTGLIFFGLSGYALTTRKDFNYLGGFLSVGFLVVFVAMIANLFLQMPALSLALSAGVILLMSGFILFDISRIINGGERNYIHATVSLYISIFNLFIHLLNILSAFSGRNNN